MEGMDTPPDVMEPLNLFPSEAVTLLSQGFLDIFQPELLRVQDSLRELTVNQDEMLQSIHEKKTGLEEMAVANRIIDTLQKVPSYKTKISNLSRQMLLLSKRIKRLQQRALKLKEGRVQRELQRKREMERRAQQERMLEARPAAK